MGWGSTVGVRVTLIEARDRLLEFLDDEIAEVLQYHLRDGGNRLSSIFKHRLEHCVTDVDPEICEAQPSQAIVRV